jgi:hypothetical protein
MSRSDMSYAEARCRHHAPLARSRRGGRWPSTSALCALLAAAAAVQPSAAARLATAATRCGAPGYSYAGLQDARRAHGVRATLVELAKPVVEDGHVAAWVGVRGPGAGPGGADAWLQIGLSAFSDGSSRMYFEVNRPGTGPVYTEVAPSLVTGERHDVAALEIATRPSWWRVWVDGAAVSPPLHLPGSSGRWNAVATAEAWDGGRPVCNRFAYRFEDVSVTARRGGVWSPVVVGSVFHDPGYRILREPEAAFVADAIGWPR